MEALLYTWSSCSFCQRAKEILERHGVPYTERVMDGNRKLASQLAKSFGQTTMPYILLDGDPIGGLSELEELAARGELRAES